MKIRQLPFLFFSLLFAIQTNAQVNLSAGLVGYYPFNGNFSDQSGNSNNGIGQNGVTFGTDQWGNANSAAFFDGVNDWVSIAPSASISPSKHFSIAFRFKSNNASYGQVLFAKADYTVNPNNYQYHIGFNYSPFGSNGLWMGTRHQGNCTSTTFLSDHYIIDTTNIINSNQWYCVAMIFDNGVKSIYINGALAVQETVTTGPFPNQTDSCTAGSLRFGTWWAGDPEYFNGMLDEVRIYNRALNTSEIDSICNFSPVSTLDCPTIDNLPDTIGICNNASVPLNPTLNIPSGSTPTDTFWSPATGLSDPNILNPVATVSTPTNYVITVKAVTQTNLVVNGDFSSGNTGFSSSYVPGTGGSYGLCTNPATYGVDVSPSNLHSLWASFGDHTTGSGKMLVVNGSQSVGANIWCETIAVQPNTDYDFSAWLSSVEPTYPAILQFEINGLPIGSLLNAPLPTGVWGNFSAAWNSGNNTTATICITNQNTSFDGNDFALDDISFRGVCVVKDSVYIKTGAVSAAFTTPDTACTGSPIQFVSAQSGIPSMTYYWNFGDGSTANSSTSSHSYTNSGLYTVTLAISDTGGCTDTLSKQIFIREPYDTTAALSLCKGESITFGSQTISDSGTFVQVFQSIGGCDSTVHLTVTLNPQPSVDFTSTTALNMPVTFTNTSVNATSFLWEFGDGSTSNDFSPIHQYTNAGTHTACLTGWNDEGCSEKICKEILTEIFTAVDVPLAFSPNGDGNNDVLYVRGGVVKEMTFRIYNRWGQLIFESHSLNEGWDGRFKGKLQDLETVAYVLQATFIDGTTVQKQGNVTILR